MIRRVLIWVLWALATLSALWGAGYLAFGPSTTTAIISGSSSSPQQTMTIERTPVFGGIFVFLGFVVVYAVLGHALYIRHYGAFRVVAGVYIVLALLAISVGFLFRPSALLLLIAALLTIGMPQDDVPRVEQQRHNGV
jgi:hypothetical protein